MREYAQRGIDISNSMPPGGQGLNRGSAVAKLMNQQKQMILSMGQFLGEEVHARHARHRAHGFQRSHRGAPRP
jgi:hypothetical protein